MKFFERLLIVLAIIGILFKFLNWKGSDFMLIVSLCGLSLYYFPFGFYLLSRKENWKNTWLLALIGGFSIFLLPQGILFKLLSWIGGTTILIAGLFTAVCCMIFFFFLRNKPGYDQLFLKQMLTRIAVLGFLSLSAFLLNPELIIRIQEGDDEEMIRLRLEYRKDRSNPEKKKALEDYYKIRSITRIRGTILSARFTALKFRIFSY